VVFYGRTTNLHNVWDSRLAQQAGYNVTSLTDELERLNLVQTAIGTPVLWAEEAHVLARDVAYRLPAGRELGPAYLDASLPTLRRQLLIGGIRLASLLNSVLDGPRRLRRPPPPTSTRLQSPPVPDADHAGAVPWQRTVSRLPCGGLPKLRLQELHGGLRNPSEGRESRLPAPHKLRPIGRCAKGLFLTHTELQSQATSRTLDRGRRSFASGYGAQPSMRRRRRHPSFSGRLTHAQAAGSRED